ncbi:MAG: hypothetical protein WD847_11565 [Pirellulales bacterium]
MTEVTISDELHARMSQFKQVVEAVIEDQLEVEPCVEFILDRGIDLILAELLGQIDDRALLTTIQKLGIRHPEQVYGFLAEVCKLGMDEQKRQDMRSQFGFHTAEPTTTDE